MSCSGFLAIETERLLLRRLQLGDLERFASYRADAELARYQGWKPMSIVEAAAFVDEMSCAPSFIKENWLQIAIAELPDGAIVGDIGFCLHAQGELEVGFTLRRESQSKGLATEAIKALIEALRFRPEVHRIVGIVDARNVSSIRVLERLGMAMVAREAAVFKGEPCTELRYQLELPPSEGPQRTP
jgi:RimJ/RimL family protein N-acetyltransferase